MDRGEGRGRGKWAAHALLKRKLLFNCLSRKVDYLHNSDKHLKSICTGNLMKGGGRVK